MKTSGLFTIHEYTIPVKELNKPIYLYPLGDIHKFAPLHSAERWEETLSKARDRGGDAYLIGMGDYLDFMSSSERSAYIKSEFHDSSVQRIERMVDEDTRAFASDLSFFDNRIIGLIGGNHDFTFARGENSTQTLCRLLNTKYLGVVACIRLKFAYENHVAHIDVYAHHGKGAARLLGGSLNRLCQVAESFDCDLFLMGHDHKDPAGKNPRMKLSEAVGNLALVERTQLFVRTGSFLRGYIDGEASYVADAAMNPSYIGATEVSFIPSRPRNTTLRIEMHATI
jgi:predicted phosphodiesterase